MALTDNPMSLVVTGNVTVGATLEASVPTTETRLLSTMDVNTTVTITVPGTRRRSSFRCIFSKWQKILVIFMGLRIRL